VLAPEPGAGASLDSGMRAAQDDGLEACMEETRPAAGGWLPLTWGLGHVAAILLTWAGVASGIAWGVPMIGCVVASGLLAFRIKLPGSLGAASRRAGVAAVLVVGGALAAISSLWLSSPVLLALQIAWILVGLVYVLAGLIFGETSLLVTGPAWLLGVAATWFYPAAALSVFLAIAVVCEVGEGAFLVGRQRLPSGAAA
jgi:hypothetical protein